MEENKNAVGKLFDKFYSRLDYLKGEWEKEDDENVKIVYKAKIEELDSFIDELDSKISKIIDGEYQNLWESFVMLLKLNKEEISEERKRLYGARICELDGIMNMIDKIIYEFKGEEE